MKRRWTTLAAVLLVGAGASKADGPKDNIPAEVRRIPAVGLAVPDDDRKALESALATLQEAIGKLEVRLNARTRELLPDVQVFYKAVHDALTYREFFATRE